MILQLRATKYFWTGLRIPILLRTRPIIILYVRDMCKVCTYIVDNICRYTHHHHYPTRRGRGNL